MNKVGISFKDNEKELYEYLKSQLSPSIFIKQLIKDKMESEGKISPKTEPVKRKRSQIII